MFLKTKKNVFQSHPFPRLCRKKRRRSVRLVVYRVLKYLRPHKFLGVFLLNGQYSYRTYINLWIDCESILDKHRLRVMSICNTQMSMFIYYYSFTFSKLSQSCHLLYRVVYPSIECVRHLAIRIADVARSISRKKKRWRSVKEFAPRNDDVIRRFLMSQR